MKAILWDIDGTLLDFSKSERYALKTTLEEIGVAQCTEEMTARYAQINLGYWKALERQEVTKEQVFYGRFNDFFREYNIFCEDIPRFNLSYQGHLGEVFFENEHSLELCRKLKGQVRQYIVTNGTAPVQKNKLKLTGLDQMMDGAFISDELGAEKPSMDFFLPVLECLQDVRKEEIMIVGDSLTSDMKGGNNAGIVCCWYNPEHQAHPQGIHIDYEIEHLWEVEQILKERSL